MKRKPYEMSDVKVTKALDAVREARKMLRTSQNALQEQEALKSSCNHFDLLTMYTYLPHSLLSSW